MRKTAQYLWTKGFTLIELLIVIAVIGILAVVVLSAINPIEQMKKGRDTGRKSDAAELLNAAERYHTTYGCYPWNRSGGTCGSTALTAKYVVAADFTAPGVLADLITINELKTQFANRSVFSGSGQLYISEANGPNGNVSVCFEPESSSGRTGASGPIRNNTNTAAGSCAGSYVGQSATCDVCVPQ